jgi:hypothetical protein
MPDKRQKIEEKPTEKSKSQKTSKNSKFPQIWLRKTTSGNAVVQYSGESGGNDDF